MLSHIDPERCGVNIFLNDCGHINTIPCPIKQGVIKKIKRRVKRGEPELVLQSAIVDALKPVLRKEVLLTAFPAGGGGRVRGAKLKKAGLQAGWPDIQLVYQGFYYGLEVKTETGRLSPAQIDLHKRLTDDGCSVAVARSVSDALEIIVDWGLARKHKQNVESGSPTSIA
jgi:hypothetical protein